MKRKSTRLPLWKSVFRVSRNVCFLSIKIDSRCFNLFSLSLVVCSKHRSVLNRTLKLPLFSDIFCKVDICMKPWNLRFVAKYLSLNEIPFSRTLLFIHMKTKRCNIKKINCCISIIGLCYLLSFRYIDWRFIYIEYLPKKPQLHRNLK